MPSSRLRGEPRSIAWSLHNLEREISDLVCWCDHPNPEPLGNDWLSAVKDKLHVAFGHSTKKLHCEGETTVLCGVSIGSLLGRLRDTQSQCFKLVTLLCNRPALSTVPFDEWTSPSRRRLVESIAETKDELRRIVAELDSMNNLSPLVKPAPNPILKHIAAGEVVVTVSIESIQATHSDSKDSEMIDLPSQDIARWLKVLTDHPNQWFLPAEYEQHDKLLYGIKPTDKLRSLKKKCPKLAKLIEPSKRNGMRFNPMLCSPQSRAPQCANN